jgi:aryl-alcohol dehydrogenase-like predicted oxidoreductase
VPLEDTVQAMGDLVAAGKVRVDSLRAFADTKGCTPGQLALAWLLHQPDGLVPIPGTKRVSYLRENVAAAAVELTPEEERELSRMFDPSLVSGERY